MNKITHLNRQIPPEAHTPMYNFHKYWSRKTWNVVGEFIETYCPEGGIVFDPFGGSGVSAIEALKRNRKAIICDISPIAAELIRLTIKPVSLIKLQQAFESVEKSVKSEIQKLYMTPCRKCRTEFAFDCAIWKNEKCTEIRYSACPNCKDSRTEKNPLKLYDKELLKTIHQTEIRQWYPDNRLYHINGNPFKEKQKYESIDGLFTKRNLFALAMLMEAIEKEPNKVLRDFLRIGFSSMVHLCTRMTPVRPSRPLSSAWTQHSYWYANEFMEQNVWQKFESAIVGKQGLLRAKAESNEYFQNVKFGRTVKDVVHGNADIFIYSGSCLDLMRQMRKFYGYDGCADYIFTDPPYSSSIQYGELSYLWVSWLKLDSGYLEKLDADEIVHNERQNKDFDVYASLLGESFRGMFDVLKPDRYLSLTFHNPNFKVRNAVIRMGTLAGFELEKIHHQELAHSSPKSLLQPFGSAQGDFYLRFHRQASGEKSVQLEEIDELRFEKIVTDTTIKVLAERGDPTPYTLIINAIDPELAKRGFFSELNTGLNVEKVLKKHLNRKFVLIDGKIGGASGKLWWFKTPNLVPHLEKIPLSERVEQTVLRQLQAKGKISFTDAWEAVSIAFPNSLTSDQTSIRDALEDYARQVSGGFWMIKPYFKPGEVEKEHTTVIAMLAEIGRKAGYEIYIGKVEQHHDIDTPYLKKTGKLKQYMTYDNLSNLQDISNSEIVGDMDILWIRDNKAEYAFEVECTTSMTGALLRGSNLESSVKKAMLLPADRKNQLARKLKSPMFYDNYLKNNWNVIYIDMLYSEWNKSRAEIAIDELMNCSLAKKDVNNDDDQLGLFYSGQCDEEE